MPGILDRYVLRETLQTWLVVTLVLLVILVTNQFASVLGDAAANKLPRDAIFQVMGLTSVQYLTILVPVAWFLSIMLALARLYHDSEMAAMMACGIGPTQLYRPILGAAALLAAGVGALSLFVAPSAVRQIQDIVSSARREASLGVLEAGRFISFGGDAVLYAAAVTPDQHLHDVFLERRVRDRVEAIVADEAWQTEADKDGVRVVTFARGTRYEGVPGDPRFRVIDFEEHGIPYSLPAAGPAKVPAQAKPFAELLASAERRDRGELHWRLSVPLTLFVLAVVAVPLAKSEPRRGRFSGLAAAVLVYLIYANLLGAGKGWIERGVLPPSAGLWWVHAAFLLAAAGLLAVHAGMPRRLWWALRHRGAGP